VLYIFYVLPFYGEENIIKTAVLYLWA